jgi:hypothetical protein
VKSPGEKNEENLMMKQMSDDPHLEDFLNERVAIEL